ncbi:cob(I)yrinic acid a,c-diamide adenosyltransferase [Wohlfahrtiimonas chitiniclastica]|uniref:cob(I)yrinic acid a,c-diamide adenosyltransferase n=1 Tax=Wohlfahrtiimonas chitiniclastica TaxID=400946 RepID=UPI001BD09006|nr:cob(I)yrinic acid a,c-diamide adenosyltransferase [Wohlfahrtiimonas chitiniclastica]MBS7814786.1 cob(I)yrinic acid a,c-diamide adenosyltransferase [Wohlfahrtiimonas chitiniclastica]
MGNRLSKIVTKTGDHGETGLMGTTRVLKDHPRIEAIGSADELNAQVGLLMAHLPESLREIHQELLIIQHHLFNVGGELVMPEYAMITSEMVTWLETRIVHYNEALPHLKEFILPSGSLPTCHAHVCRTVARRLERMMVTLHQAEPLNPEILQYINRLSDYFFVLARTLACHTQDHEVLWNKALIE